MTTAATIATPATPLLGIAPVLYRISVDEYDRMVEAGVFGDARIELIQGFLVKKMPKKPPHVITTIRVDQHLLRILPPGWHTRREAPVRIPNFDEPEPDVAVVAGVLDDYSARHPGPAEVALIVEVSESTLAIDRGEKLSANAAGGIPVYWIVNLVDCRIEVYSAPGPAGYQVQQYFGPGTEIPVVVAGAKCGRIAVDEILP
jgi:Uma2 family endonuclease